MKLKFENLIHYVLQSAYSSASINFQHIIWI